MEAVAKELELSLQTCFPLCFPAKVGRSADSFVKVRKFTVPYDKDGKLSTRVTTTWDLRPGQKMKINRFNNIEGAGQSGDREKNITCDTEFVVGETNNEHCAIEFKYFWQDPPGSSSWKYSVKRMGLWWLRAAKLGLVDYLPIVNVDAQEVGVSSKSGDTGDGDL
jgi:hypothetical protein